MESPSNVFSLRCVGIRERRSCTIPAISCCSSWTIFAFLDIYHERIRAFHVKDAEFDPSGRSGVYGGYQNWIDRPGRFRSLGDGQVDFGGIFSKLAQYDFPGWAVMEWECALKHPEDGAREGAPFIRDHIIRVTEHAFDDFAGGQADRETNRRLLGL